MRTMIFAHRGASAYAPENTMEAFKMACDMGADAFELDVQLTKDGQVVVIHDEKVDRTSNGAGNVSYMTYDELLRLDFSNHKGGYKNVEIPLLTEVYRLARENGKFVNVEIKDRSYSDSGYPIVDKLLELENACGMTGMVAYSSFNHYVLREMRKISPEIQTGILYICGLVDVWEYAQKLEAQAIHPLFLNLQNINMITECRKRGIAVRAWTVDSPEDIRNVLTLGVDAIISNRPDLVRSIRDITNGSV